MNSRRDFLKKGLASLAVAALTPLVICEPEQKEAKPKSPKVDEKSRRAENKLAKRQDEIREIWAVLGLGEPSEEDLGSALAACSARKPRVIGRRKGQTVVIRDPNIKVEFVGRVKSRRERGYGLREVNT